MSKYQPLSDRLAGHAGEEWRASFTEIEDLLGFPLPKAARSGAAWWTRQGFTARADARAGEVAFSLGDVSPAAMQAVLDAPEPERGPEPGPEGGPERKPQPQAAAVVAPGEPERLAPTRKGWGLIAAAAGGVALMAGLGIAAGRALRERA